MIETAAPRYSTFSDWRSWVVGSGLLPVVVVAGSRGKTIVGSFLEAVMREAGLSVANWSSNGVDIEGVRQRGELGPWQDVEDRLTDGTLDVAIREVDWATAATLATGPRLPLLAITNVCANREDCIEAGDAMLANVAMPALLTAVVRQGWLVLNGEDLAVSADLAGTSHNRLLVTMGLDSPAIEHQFQYSGNLAWARDDDLLVALHGERVHVGSRGSMPSALDGTANFQVFNGLLAASLARVMGIDPASIRRALARHVSDPNIDPGSFNIMTTGNSVFILDRPAASWYMRPVLRALRDYRRTRLLTVFSGLRGTLREDTAEIGRLLGRISNIMIVSDDEPDDAERITLAMDGARRNEVPPMVIPVSSEVEGVRRAMGLARPKDVIYVLSDDPAELWESIKQLGPLVHSAAPTPAS